MTDTLTKPFTLPFSGHAVQSRFLKSAMTERLCTYEPAEERGKPTPEYIESYVQWGQGKLGVLVLGNIPVDKRHLEAAGNAVIDPTSSWDPVEAFKPVIKAAGADGALVVGQLTHAGRQCSSTVNPEPVSASANPAFKAMNQQFNESRAMTVEEIEDYIKRMAFAADVLYKAGANGAQLHAAHGYLLSQFLSSATNRREDKYGGSFENRSRIVFEVINAIREKVPDKKFLLSIKINSADFASDGWTVNDCKQIVSKLEEHGVDIIELSGGTYEASGFQHRKESTKKRESYFVEFADEIRPQIKRSALAVTGGFRSRAKCAEAIEGNTCDLIGLARPLCADPQLPRHIFDGKTEGAAPNNVDAQLQTPAAILQIHAIAEKRPIYDLSVKEEADKVVEMIKGQKPPPPAGKYPAM